MRRLFKCFFVIVFTLKTAQVLASSCAQQSSFYRDIAEIMTAASDKPTILDADSILPWSGQAKYECGPPFKATYKTGNKEITFVAVEHIDSPATFDDPRLKTISNLIEQLRPEVLVLETATKGVTSPGAFFGFSANCVKDNKFLCGEAAYANSVASQIGAMVQGGEAIPGELNQEILKMEENKSNLLIYRSTQAVLSFQRRGIPIDEWEKNFSDEIQKNGIPKNDIWTFAEYENWTNEFLKSSPKKVETSWLEPKNDQSASEVQKISYKVEQAREPMILKK